MLDRGRAIVETPSAADLERSASNGRRLDKPRREPQLIELARQSATDARASGEDRRLNAHLVRVEGVMKVSTAVIIDDDVFSIRILDAALRWWRFNVVSTDQPSTVRGMLTIYRPALVIADITLSGLDMASVVHFIRSTPELSAATVLLHSALDADALSQRAYQCGADGAIVKSPSVADLDAQLEYWLSGARSPRPAPGKAA
jgi:CheY-like chemotaxis protein